MFGFLHDRRRVAEWMDAPDADPIELRRSLDFIRRINNALGYTKTSVTYLKQFSRAWQPGQQIRILDVATGSADIPRAALAWGKSAGFDVRITAIDFHAKTIRIAAQEAHGMELVQANALSLPFADAGFDYVMTAMFLHHLSDEQTIAVLKEMNRVAARGVIICDLLRTRRAYAWISLFTLFSIPMVKHDSRASVAHAFTKSEIVKLAAAAGLDYAGYRRHFGHRFVIAGERTITRNSNDEIRMTNQ
jgi:ubiquinone/menaquinone biosynthesis C-methylase UbiE